MKLNILYIIYIILYNIHFIGTLLYVKYNIYLYMLYWIKTKIYHIYYTIYGKDFIKENMRKNISTEDEINK